MSRDKKTSTRAVTRGQHLVRLLQERDELLEYERNKSERAEAQREIERRLLAIVTEDSYATLKSVAGWVRFLRREELDQEGRDHALAVIERKIVGCQRLIAELVEVNLSAQAPLVLTRIELKETLANLIESVSVADARTVVFDTEVTEGAVFGDRTKLTSTFATLLVSMLVGGGLLRVALRQEAGSFIVTLAGPRRRMPTAGLDPDLFALERRIVRVHGGSIRLVDRADEDVIEVALPALVDGGRAPLTKTVHPGLAGTRVLIVGTGSPSTATATFALRHHGANVLCVGDVVVAVDACAGFTPDVIVLCAGDESVSREVAQLRGLVGATGIVVVTEAGSEEAALDRDAGVDAHVVAPVDPYVLVNAVEAVVRFARQVEPPA